MRMNRCITWHKCTNHGGPLETPFARRGWRREGGRSTDTVHRGNGITAPRSARYSAHVSSQHADNLWTGRPAWGDRSFHPDWNPFVGQASMRQLALFGVPPPGRPYWTPQTIAQLAARYPGLDTRRWRG
jgi:hypothetical protein